MVNNINITRSSMPPYKEYCEEIKDLWDSRWLTNMGNKHQRLRAALAEYLGVEHMDLLTNGHMAIELCLHALDLSGEVITTPFTFVSTTQAIVRNGLTPVFCDIDPYSYTIDPNKLEQLITSRTCAIVPVHTYGSVCNVEKIEAIARRHNLKVLYDAAHAFGVRYKGQGIGSFGDVSCFSFHATKVFHSVEGGAACFHDEMFGEKLARLKNFGLSTPEEAEELGANAKLDEFRAAMGLCNLRHIDCELEKRRRVAERYYLHLKGVPGLQLQINQPDVQSNFSYFPVVFHESEFGADRDMVKTALAEQGINSRRYFYPLTSTFACYRGLFDPGTTPVAQWIAQRVLCLPMYADMSQELVDRICGIVLACRRGGARI